MSHDWIGDESFFRQLDQEDARKAAAIRAAGCAACGGRLDRGDYPRKPRGGAIGIAGELFDRRRSFCCARVGCRKRATPESCIFLGRKVYLAVTVIVAAWRAEAPAAATPPRQTVRRWIAWFATQVPRTSWFVQVRARVMPLIEPSEVLPHALVERFGVGRTVAEALATTLRIMAPLSVTRVAV